MFNTRECVEKLKAEGIELTIEQVAEMAKLGVFDAQKDSLGKWQIPEKSIDVYIRHKKNKKRTKWIATGTVITLLTVLLATVSSLKDGIDLLRDFVNAPPTPIHMSAGFIEGQNPFVLKNASISLEELPDVSEQTKSFLKDVNRNGVLVWPSINGIWIKLTSPVGNEIIVNNTVGVKVNEYKQISETEINCLSFKELSTNDKTDNCVECGGQIISEAVIDNISVPTDTTSIAWKQSDGSNVPDAYDLSFPHSFKAYLNFPKAGIYKLEVVAKYTYQSKEMTATQKLDNYAIIGLPQCTNWTYIGDLRTK